MTKPKVENDLYDYIQGVISNVLPLEYAIRAAESINPEGMLELKRINSQIRSCLNGENFSDEFIDREKLMDFAWDELQVGFRMTRRDTWIYPNDVRERIDEGIASVKDAVKLDLDELNNPATRFFRICDLLNGNDVRTLLDNTAKCIQHSMKYEKRQSILISKFPRGIREPIYLHPSVRFTNYQEETGRYNFGMLLDLEGDISAEDLMRQVHEFLYQYACLRNGYPFVPDGGKLSDKLIHSFLIKDFYAKDSDDKIKRLDGFASTLSGLYCWDCRHRNSMLLKDAIEETLENYPLEFFAVEFETIKKNYTLTNSKIEDYKKKFLNLDPGAIY